jgi:hypothetical protein
MSLKSTKEKQQQVLELYFCSEDRRFITIGNVTGICITSVSRILQWHFDGKINYEKENYKIYHSKIN